MTQSNLVYKPAGEFVVNSKLHFRICKPFCKLNLIGFVFTAFVWKHHQFQVSNLAALKTTYITGVFSISSVGGGVWIFSGMTQSNLVYKPAGEFVVNSKLHFRICKPFCKLNLIGFVFTAFVRKHHQFQVSNLAALNYLYYSNKTSVVILL